MIDNVTIKCFENIITKHLSPEYFRNKYDVKSVGINDYTFKLYNPENLTSSFLRIVCSHIGSDEKYVFFSITGSLRKWWFGDKSIKDFSKQDYVAAINLLFEILEIPQRERKNFFMPRIEVGMNNPVKVSCIEILNKIVGYKNNCYFRNSYKTGIVYQSKTNKGIKLYDKIEEISKDFKNKRIKDFDESQFLNDNKGRNLLRIEFTIGGGQSKVNKELGFDNLEDSIVHFDNLYSYFWKQLQHIQYSDAYNDVPSMDFTGKSYKDFLIYLAHIGKRKLGIECSDRIIRQLNPVDRRKAKKLLHDENYSPKFPYDIHRFMINIRNNMLLPMYKSKCLFLVKKLSLNKLSAS